MISPLAPGQEPGPRPFIDKSPSACRVFWNKPAVRCFFPLGRAQAGRPDIKQGMFMNRMIKFAAVAAFAALAACGGQGDDSLAENVEQAYDNQADQLDAIAENATNEAQSDTLEDQADRKSTRLNSSH